eukprot:GDKK01051449.1.p1 GENE.GDKK01051449.1~~GDKK01051449.1.p1  ORF type:complete len:150 (-),score=3.56 GDKK01051449.1:301-750(-)
MSLSRFVCHTAYSTSEEIGGGSGICVCSGSESGAGGATSGGTSGAASGGTSGSGSGGGGADIDVDDVEPGAAWPTHCVGSAGTTVHSAVALEVVARFVLLLFAALSPVLLSLLGSSVSSSLNRSTTSARVLSVRVLRSILYVFRPLATV